MKTIRAGMGLGDSLYLQSVVRHMLSQGHKLKVASAWPDVFRPLRVEVMPFTRGVNLVSHYVMRKGVSGTSQFEDMCRAVGISEPVELRLDWMVRHAAVVERVKSSAAGKPIVCVQLPRSPMDRKDGFGKNLLPDCSVLQRVIELIRHRVFLVQIGSGKALYEFKNIDLDLSNKTNVSDLLDVASIADGFLGYVSFLVPLAESFSKPALFVWSRAGLKSHEQYVRQITPEKILHRATSKHLMDDCSEQELTEAADAFLR